MFLGIPYIAWVGIFGAIALWISLLPKKKKKTKKSGTSQEDLDQYIKSLQEVTEMKWTRLSVSPEDLTAVLNKIEDLKISVQYQFYLRENRYDMIFRCQKSKMEEFKKVMSDYI